MEDESRKSENIGKKSGDEIRKSEILNAQNTEKILLIERYFPDLTSLQKIQFVKLDQLYRWWNSKINVISRKDIDNLYIHHVLHSLAIAKFIRFNKGTRILDAGTGGGFPGIPLAILFPDVQFTLADSISKKIKVVEAVKNDLKLKNCTPLNKRIEEITSRFDFILSRAVTTIPAFISLVKGKLDPRSQNEINNGILYLKGGEVEEELKIIHYPYHIINIKDFFSENFFETKKLAYIDLTMKTK